MKIELLQTCIWCEKPVKNFGQTAMTCSSECDKEIKNLMNSMRIKKEK